MHRLVATSLAFFVLASASNAQDFPSRPVTLVVPYGAGSPADVLGRLLAQRMTETLGQQIVVENVGGAGGTTGASRVMKAPPDGYQFVQGGTGTHAQSQSLYKQPPYDAAADFTPLMLITESPLVLVVRKDLPAKDLKEFIAYAKANPVTYGSAGVGSSTHLSCALLADAGGFKATHVPYRGMGPALVALIANEVQYSFAGLLPGQAQVKANRLRALGVTSAKRSPLIPDLPTIIEAGLPGFEVIGWYGVLAPAGTPPVIVDRLHAEIIKILAQRDIRNRIAGDGAEVVGDTPAQFAAFLKADIARWAPLIKQSGAKLE